MTERMAHAVKIYDVIEIDGIDPENVGIRVSIPKGMRYAIAIEQLRQVARKIKSTEAKADAAAERRKGKQLRLP